MARNRENLARKKIGYALTIQLENGPKKGEWERVGFVEQHPDQVRAYKDRHYPSIKNFKVQGVRVDLRPLVDESKPQDRNARS